MPADIPSKAVGHVVTIGGSNATFSLAAPERGEPAEAGVTVGKFVALQTPRSAVVGVVTEVDGSSRTRDGELTARMDLLGEIKERDGGGRFFHRGITDYPVVGNPVVALGSEMLRVVYDTAGADIIDIGNLQQDSSIPAYIKVNEMLHKHFAIFGSTGVGKSSGVAVILRAILASKPNLRIFLVDPHNEYARSFREEALVFNPHNLKLPFWLFNFEETIDVFFRGRPGLDEEVEILAHVIPQAKAQFALTRRGEGHSLRKADSNGSFAFTVDTPVPYLLSDLVNLIDERMGKLENRSNAARYARLISRIELVRKDLRYGFMFDNANVGGDTMVEVLAQLFRLQPDGRPMTVMQLAGFPAEVVELGRVRARPHGLRVRAVERRRSRAAVRVRGGPPLRTRRQVDRFRPHPQGHLPHRQGGPQVWRLPRPHHAAPGRARRHHHLPVQHAVCHAHGERARPERDPGGGLGCGGEPARVRALARHARGVRLRRGRGAADAALLCPARCRAHPQERVDQQHPSRPGQGHRRSLHCLGRRPLARRHDGQPAQGRRGARRWRSARSAEAEAEAAAPASPAETERALLREAALKMRRALPQEAAKPDVRSLLKSLRK